MNFAKNLIFISILLAPACSNDTTNAPASQTVQAASGSAQGSTTIRGSTSTGTCAQSATNTGTGGAATSCPAASGSTQTTTGGTTQTTTTGGTTQTTTTGTQATAGGAAMWCDKTKPDVRYPYCKDGSTDATNGVSDGWGWEFIPALGKPASCVVPGGVADKAGQRCPI